MRGNPERQMAMLTTLKPGDLIPADHPIRRIRWWSTRSSASSTASSTRCTRRGSAECAAGAAAQGDGVDGDVLDPVGAGVLRTTQLRLVVQVVPGSCRSTRRRSTRRRSRRTVDGCWITRSRTGSSPRSSPRRSCVVTCRVITSRSMARCWRRGRRTRASNPKTGRRSPPPPGRNAEVSFHGQRRSNRRTPRRRIPKRGWPASPTRPRRSSPMRGIC